MTENNEKEKYEQKSFCELYKTSKGINVRVKVVCCTTDNEMNDIIKKCKESFNDFLREYSIKIINEEEK